MSNSNCAKVSKTNDEIYESESEFDSNSELDIVHDDESDTEEEEEEDDDDDKRKLALGKVHPWSITAGILQYISIQFEILTNQEAPITGIHCKMPTVYGAQTQSPQAHPEAHSFFMSFRPAQGTSSYNHHRRKRTPMVLS